VSKILVSIPAWEDTTITDTLNKLLISADKPENIVFGFGFNYKQEPDLSWLSNKYYILRDSDDYGDVVQPGIIQIRNAIRRLVTDEGYYLSIDAHANFKSGWDTTLINDIEELHRISDKFVISKQIMAPEDSTNYYTKWKRLPDQSPMGFPFPDDGYTKNNMVTDNYFLNYYVSGNFIFAKTSWLKGMEFPDYHGFPYEEPELSLAAFCNGFDVVSPTGSHCPIAAGNDPKYIFPYDERWWKFIGTDRNNREHWEKIWALDEGEMIVEARKLLLTGENKYFSLTGLKRSVNQFYDTIGL
jgi:hypothetical protein